MHKLQLVAALAQVVAAQVVATQAAHKHKVTRHAVARELTDSYAMDDDSIRTAVAAWTSDAAAAEATYGHISTWDTSGVTDMSELFCAGDYCDYYNSGAASFNENIGAWDTTEATSMAGMFRGASSFNQPLGDWSFDNIIDMRSMFYGASAFDQDLGWCVIPVASPPDGILNGAFDGTLCESTACGVVEDGCTWAPTTTLAPTAVVTPPFNVGGNTTSTCIARRTVRKFTTSAPRVSSSWRPDSDRSSFTPKKRRLSIEPQIRDRSSSIPNCPY